MKLPKRIATILKKKEQFLDDARSQLEGTVLKLQNNLFEQVIEEIISQIKVEKGVILDTSDNYRLISQLDKVYDNFNVKVAGTILPQINKNIEVITSLSGELFTMSLIDLPTRFDKIIEETKILTDLKIGLRTGKMIRGGLIETMIKGDPAQFKQLMAKSVSSQMDLKDFITVIKENINGTDEKLGSLQRQFQRFAYDTYQQYDAAYNKNLANEFGMRYFVYQGGLVRDSRDFCVCHNNKVFSIEEAETWNTWTPSDCDYPAGYEVKAKDLNLTPSYMNYPGYDPLIDRGGYNCRHILGYISDDLAFKLRPDLKK